MTKETKTEDGPRIYVACLAAYNNGKLHGAWIDADQSADRIQADIEAMLAASPEPDAEEWAIHDYSGFGTYHLSECESMDDVSELAAAISEHGPLVTWLVESSADISGCADRFEEQYAGCFESERDWAESFFEDTGELRDVPDSLARYFDYDAWARDARLGGDVTFHRDAKGLHVFWAY